MALAHADAMAGRGEQARTARERRRPDPRRLGSLHAAPPFSSRSRLPAPTVPTILPPAACAPAPLATGKAIYRPGYKFHIHRLKPEEVRSLLGYFRSNNIFLKSASYAWVQ